MGNKEDLYERLGGWPTLERVHKIFYDKVYDHPWLQQFFKDVEQKHIEAQQTAFMAQAFGGPKRYCGKAAISAHKHILITRELFDLRHAVLAETLDEVGIPPDLIEEWLDIDAAFERAIVKNSADDCKRRYANETIIDIKPPGNHTFNKS